MSFLIQHMEEDENLLTFIPAELQKHSRPSYRGIQIRFVAYKNNVNLYPVTTRKEYLKRRERTSIINITEKIFVTHRKLIRETQKETLSRWVKEIVKKAGINSFMTEVRHIVNSPLICTADQWTGYYMTETSIMKELMWIFTSHIVAKVLQIQQLKILVHQ